MNRGSFVWSGNSGRLIEKIRDLNVDSIITDNPYLIESAIYWKKNGFISQVSDYLF